MNKKIIFVFLLLFITLPKIANAVYFAQDTVILHENGERLHSDALFLAHYKTHSEHCVDGVCTIGQQFYPVTIYIPSNGKLLSSPEYSAKYPYKGGHTDGPAKDAWNEQNNKNYLTYLKENSRIITELDPGASEGGEPCEGELCMGGRIGNSRKFDLEILSKHDANNTGEPETTLTEKTSLFEANKTVISISAISILALGTLFVARFIFKKMK